MKRLALQILAHERYLSAFGAWLRVQHYVESTITSQLSHAKELLWWCEQNDLPVETLGNSEIERYTNYLISRPNERQGVRLTSASVYKHRHALRMFGEYLQVLGVRSSVFTWPKTLVLPKDSKQKELLSIQDVKSLYAACKTDALGLRDKAMLAIYYGCGLRRSEGEALQVGDLDLKRSFVHVQNSKNDHERFVPMSSRVMIDLKNYLYHARPVLLPVSSECSAFFVSKRGTGLQGQSLQMRLRALGKKAGLGDQVHLHQLRHAIATHLLGNGMSIYSIQTFLGHKSLEATQIYTQLTNNKKA